MIKFIKTLSGYSGCQISLYEENGRLFVRKLSGSEEYNPRMERQIHKQAFFQHPVLKTPKIYATGYIDGKFYADMEYIDGKTVVELIRDEEYDTARKAIHDVFTLFQRTDAVVVDATEVVKKVQSMRDALCTFAPAEPCQRTLAHLSQHTWRTHPAECHGDLTLENMLVKDGTVYLIDFLNVFHDCVEIDASKLMQDLRCHWSFRHTTLPHKGEQLLQECEDDLNCLYRQITSCDSEQLYAMLKLTLLRIYPYLKDDFTKAFLDTQLQKML